jgi:hypothetical protein
MGFKVMQNCTEDGNYIEQGYLKGDKTNQHYGTIKIGRKTFFVIDKILPDKAYKFIHRTSIQGEVVVNEITDNAKLEKIALTMLEKGCFENLPDEEITGEKSYGKVKESKVDQEILKGEELLKTSIREYYRKKK